jgi:hypothetical protein
MRARRLGLVLGLLVLAAMPLASACYAPRIESCRDPIRDFSGISSVQVVNPTRPFGFFEGGSEEVSFTLSATTTMASGSTCVQVRSELRDSAGGLVEVLDTPIRAGVSSGVLTTTRILHYHASSLTPMTLHVTALGATIDATVLEPRLIDASRPLDAGPPDSGPRDSGVPDAGRLVDGGAEDAGDGGGADDAALDAGDAGDVDGGTDDAATIDAAIDAGP